MAVHSRIICQDESVLRQVLHVGDLMENLVVVICVASAQYIFRLMSLV